MSEMGNIFFSSQTGLQEMITTISETENTARINSILDIAKESVSESEDIAIETNHHKREKKKTKIKIK